MALTLQNIAGALFLAFILCALIYNGINASRAAKAAVAQAQLLVSHGLWSAKATFNEIGGLTLMLFDGESAEPVHVLNFAALHPVAATLHHWVFVQHRELHTVEFTLADERKPDEFAGFCGDVTAHLALVGKGAAPFRSVLQTA